MINVIDVYDSYRQVIADNMNKSCDEKINVWQDFHQKNYPELLGKCTNYYEEDGYNWMKVARESVFPRRKEDYPYMEKAHENLLKVLENISKRVQEVFNIDLDINVVIYAGLCNAAGWVDEYEGKRTVLFGIDKMAELRWHDLEKIDCLVCHELCHVIHFFIRGEVIPEEASINKYNYGIWDLYEEGFAQYFEEKISRYHKDSRGENWSYECEKNEKKLKKLYLEALEDSEKGTRDFFGDWYKVLGISDTGYYMGAKFIEGLNDRYDVKTIAVMDPVSIENEVLKYLERA